MKIRNTHQQHDSRHRQRKVEKAQLLIFKQGAKVTSNQIEKILGDQSTVPIHVSEADIWSSTMANWWHYRMHSPQSFLTLDKTTTNSLLLTFYMNLRLVYGRLFSSSSSGYSMHPQMEKVELLCWMGSVFQLLTCINTGLMVPQI